MVDWDTIRQRLPVDRRSKQFGDTALVLGNGASVSISERFNYPALLDRSELSDNVIDAIPDNCEVNFEEALRVLAIATKLLGADSASDLAVTYSSIQTGLINAIRRVHPRQHEVRSLLLKAVRVLRWFPTIVTLNYDLSLYWAMMLDPARRLGNWFKDGFTDGQSFASDWSKLRGAHRRRPGATMVFYAHGNLSLVDDVMLEERKITVEGEDQEMLAAVLCAWQREHTHPLFVSERLPEFKRHRIESSPYLSEVYRNVLGDFPSNVVIFGWSLQDQDEHLLEQLLRSRPKFLAVSNFRGRLDVRRAKKVVDRAVAKVGVDKPDLAFYDAESAWRPCVSESQADL